LLPPNREPVSQLIDGPKILGQVRPKKIVRGIFPVAVGKARLAQPQKVNYTPVRYLFA
jgi:hypothetical protein